MAVRSSSRPPLRARKPSGSISRSPATIRAPLAVRRGPAQRRAHARDELGQLERLRHVVVCAELEADDDVDRVARGREDHDRDAARLADLPADLVAVEPGQHEVEDDEVERLAAEPLEPFSPVGGTGDLEARALPARGTSSPGWTGRPRPGGSAGSPSESCTAPLLA